MPPQPASVGAGPSVRPRAVVLAVTSLAFPPLRTAIRARPRDTSKRPPDPRLFAVQGSNPSKLHTPAVTSWRERRQGCLIQARTSTPLAAR